MSTNDRAALPLRLSAHVLAHLRAVAEGIAPSAAARRYLLTAADDGAALRAHLAAVDAGTAVARRAGTGPRWRLLRMAHLPVPAVALPPPLEEWAEARGYDGFSHDELLPLYELEHVAPSPSRIPSPAASSPITQLPTTGRRPPKFGSGASACRM